MAVPHDLLDAIPDPEKLAEQAEQAKQTQTEEDDGFIRFKDTDSEDESDIEVALF